MKVTLNHLMIAVYCFQFQNRILSDFSEWYILMNKSHPRCEIQIVYSKRLVNVNNKRLAK